MFLDNKRIPFIIAEIGVNHNGNAELAKKLIDAAYNAKVDAVKFQTFKAWECASKFAPTADYQKGSAENQYKLLEELELDFADFADLKEYAESLGLVFLSTPDGQKSLDFLCDIGVKAIKIASGELTNLPFLTSIAFKKLPVILSTGMGTLGEVEEAINTLKLAGANDIMLMHCTTEYPAPAEDCNLKAIQTMQKSFQLPVGFSDHTLGSEAAIAAATLGAVIAASGVGNYIGEALSSYNFGIFLPFIIAAALKTAQGSSTVAIVTTAQIIAPMLGSLGLGSPMGAVLATLAIGSGAMVVSHANDSYFWVVTQFSDMDLNTAYKAQTMATLIQGVVAVLAIYGISLYML